MKKITNLHRMMTDSITKNPQTLTVKILQESWSIKSILKFTTTYIHKMGECLKTGKDKRAINGKLKKMLTEAQ